jgi:molybdate transport system regulatory protein
MKAGNRTVGARLRIVLEPDIAIGPGKADLLDGVRTTGSIAAAGRAMGMSYKRAWYLIDTMNGCFRAPLVEATRGGRAGGGARLTPLGEEVLARYRRMQAQAEAAIEADMTALRRVLATPPDDP